MNEFDTEDKCSFAGDSDDVPSVSTRRDVLVRALRAAPVVLLLTARGAQAQISGVSAAPSAK